MTQELKNELKPKKQMIEEPYKDYPWKHQLLLIMAGAVGSISFLASSAPVLAAVNPTSLTQSGYWYGDDDIRAVLNARVGDRAYIAPALPFSSNELLTDIITNAVAEAKSVGTALIPVNFSGSHWAALAIKSTDSGVLKVIYNDSLGGAIASRPNGALLADILRQIDPNIEIIDLQQVQQSDGSSCGAFTAENLATIADLDVSNLSAEQLRNVLAQINDAETIRNSHFSILYLGDGSLDIPDLKPRAEATFRELKSENRQLINGMLNVSRLTEDRLTHLNRNGETGFSAGDDSFKHGVWLQGFVGSAQDKGNVGSNHRFKTKLHGFVLGADTQIDEDTTVGIAYSKTASKVKSSINSIDSRSANIDSDIYSLYGSGQINDKVSVHGNISYGKATVKSKSSFVAAFSDSSISDKRKAQLSGVSLVANYDYHLHENLIITPKLGGSYSQLLVKAGQSAVSSDEGLNIGKVKQTDFRGKVGVALTGFSDFSNCTLIPEISAEYSHSLWRKGNKVVISNQQNQTILSEKLNNNQGLVKLGTSLTIATDRLELGGGYEHSIQGKTRTHIGYAKVRVNF